MSTTVPNPVAPYPPVPGQPSGAGTFEPPHPYRTAEAPADGPFGNHATLTDGLVSYWPLDESSGVRADAVGSNDLTDNNTVGYVNLGPQGTVADFAAASSEYFNGNHTLISTETSFTVACWQYKAAASTRILLTSTTTDLGATRAFLFYLNSGFSEMIAYDSTAGTSIGSMVVPSASADGWHFLVGGYDAATKKAWSSVDGAPKAVTGAALTNGIRTGAAWLSIANTGASGPTTQRQGRTGFWTTMLSDADIATLYNSGLGKSYADLTTAEKVGLVSYWNLDEASGNRADSHGSNTLTDNNTVTSVDNTHPGFGKAASFVEGNSEYLSRASASLVGWPQADFHIAFWAKRSGTDADLENNYIAKSNSAGDQREWRVHTVVGQDRAYCSLTDSDGDEESISSNTGAGSFPTSTWVLVEFRRSGLEYGIAVNGGAMQTASATSVFNGTAPLLIGARNAGFGFHDGQIGPTMVWSRVLTAQERTDLYAAGAGLFYGD